MVEGKQAHVVTGRQSYEDANAGLISYESINGRYAHRPNAFSFGTANIIGRPLAASCRAPLERRLGGGIFDSSGNVCVAAYRRAFSACGRGKIFLS